MARKTTSLEAVASIQLSDRRHDVRSYSCENLFVLEQVSLGLNRGDSQRLVIERVCPH